LKAVIESKTIFYNLVLENKNVRFVKKEGKTNIEQTILLLLVSNQKCKRVVTWALANDQTQ